MKDAHKSEIQGHQATFEKLNMQNSRCDSLESKQCLQLVTSSTHYRVRRASPKGGSYADSPSPKIAPSEFEPDFVSTLWSVLDAAVDQIDVGNRTPATK